METEIYDQDEQIKKANEAGQRIHDHLTKVDWKEINRRIAEGTNRRIQQELKTIGEDR